MAENNPQMDRRYMVENYRPLQAEKISDLNEYCLNEVIKYLSPQDIRNVAKIKSRYLRFIFAKNLYKRFTQLGIKTFYIDSQNSKKHDKLYFPNKHNLYVSRQTITLCGSFVESLEFQTRDQKLIESWIEYCPNLEQITINRNYYSSSNLPIFCEPLKKLKILRFYQCELISKTITDFQQWCPNICQLEFEDVYDIKNIDFITHHFPCLLNLSILNIHKIQLKELMEFIELNSQIEVLKIILAETISETMLENIYNKLPSLKKLTLKLDSDRTDIQPLPITKPKINKVTVATLECDQNWTRTLRIASIHFNLLEILNLSSSTYLKNSEEQACDVNSIAVMENLQCLILTRPKLNRLLTVASRMPNLIKLVIMDDDVDNIELLNECFERFPKLIFLKLTAKYHGRRKDFTIAFHKKFNQVVGDRKAIIKFELNNFSVTVEVSKETIINLASGEVICKKIPKI